MITAHHQTGPEPRTVKFAHRLGQSLIEVIRSLIARGVKCTLLLSMDVLFLLPSTFGQSRETLDQLSGFKGFKYGTKLATLQKSYPMMWAFDTLSSDVTYAIHDFGTDPFFTKNPKFYEVGGKFQSVLLHFSDDVLYKIEYCKTITWSEYIAECDLMRAMNLECDLNKTIQQLTELFGPPDNPDDMTWNWSSAANVAEFRVMSLLGSTEKYVLTLSFYNKQLQRNAVVRKYSK